MKKLYRSKSVKMISGVCGGLSAYTGFDVTIFRLLWAVAAVFSFGLGLVAYIVAAIIIPVDPGYTDIG